MTNYYKNILAKLFELLHDEFKGHEVKVFLNDNPAQNGYFIDSISLKCGEKRLRMRGNTHFYYEYPVSIILRRRIVKGEDTDDLLGEYETRIRERLVERNRYVSSYWHDNIVESSDPPDDEIIETTDETSDIVRRLDLHWIAFVVHQTTES